MPFPVNGNSQQQTMPLHPLSSSSPKALAINRPSTAFGTSPGVLASLPTKPVRPGPAALPQLDRGNPSPSAITAGAGSDRLAAAKCRVSGGDWPEEVIAAMPELNYAERNSLWTHYNAEVKTFFERPDIRSSDVFQLLFNQPDIFEYCHTEQVTYHILDVIKTAENTISWAKGYGMDLTGMPLDEIASIDLYTAGLSDMINSGLRKGIDYKLSPIIYALKRALSRLPLHPGQVNRVAQHAPNFINYLVDCSNKHTTINFGGFVSTSNNAERIDSWGTSRWTSDYDGNILFKINSQFVGRYIAGASRFDREEEVLFDTNTRFAVHSVREIQRPKGKRYVVEMTACHDYEQIGIGARIGR